MLVEQGVILLELGKPRESIDYFSKAIAEDSGYKQAWLRRAEAYDQLGRRASANADRRRAEAIEESAGDG